MGRFIRSFCFVLLFFCSILSSASTLSSELSGLLSKYRSFSAGFIQKTYSNRGRLLSTSKGDFWLARPNQFRWSVVSPNKQVIVGDGRFVWIYNVALMQVTKQRFVNRAQSPINVLVSDSKTLDAYYTVSKKNLTSHRVEYHLVARDQEGSIRSISLRFDKAVLSSMTLDNSLGQHAVFLFSKVSLNPTLSSDVFRFIVPKNVDVINNSPGD